MAAVGETPEKSETICMGPSPRGIPITRNGMLDYFLKPPAPALRRAWLLRRLQISDRKKWKRRFPCNCGEYSPTVLILR